MHPWVLLSVFCASVGPSVNSRQISVHLRVLPSTVCAEAEPSVSIRQLSVCPRDLRSTFRAAAGHSVNFRQLFEDPWDLPLSSVNFSCIRGTFQKVPYGRWTVCHLHQLFVWSRDLPSTLRTIMGPSVSFPYVRGTFCQLSIRPRDIPSSFVNFSCVRVIILQYSVHQRNLPSTSDNFRCIHGTCRQLFVHHFEFPSYFRASTGHSVNFHDIFVCPRNLP